MFSDPMFGSLRAGGFHRGPGAGWGGGPVLAACPLTADRRALPAGETAQAHVLLPHRVCPASNLTISPPHQPTTTFDTHSQPSRPNPLPVLSSITDPLADPNTLAPTDFPAVPGFDHMSVHALPHTYLVKHAPTDLRTEECTHTGLTIHASTQA